MVTTVKLFLANATKARKVLPRSVAGSNWYLKSELHMTHIHRVVGLGIESLLQWIHYMCYTNISTVRIFVFLGLMGSPAYHPQHRWHVLDS